MSGNYRVSGLVAILTATLIVSSMLAAPVEGYRVCTFKGLVVDHGWRSMTVKSNGQCAEVNVGWRTKYLPNRRPCLGERVAVDFILEDGYMKATKVVSLTPLPAPSQCYPPAPPGSSTCRTVGDEEPMPSREGCAPPRGICSTKPPAHVSDPTWAPGKKPAPAKPSKTGKKPAEPTESKPTAKPGEEKEDAKDRVTADEKKFKVLTGEVVASSPKSLSIRATDAESESAELVTIKVGLKTKFEPFRRPAVGEKVKVEWRQENGDKFGYTVKVQ